MSSETSKKTSKKKSSAKKTAAKKASKPKAGAGKTVTKKKTVAKKATAKSKPAQPASENKISEPSILNVTPEERWKMIAVAAYHKAEKRGFATGHDFDDWTEAEKEIDAFLKGT